MSKVYLRIFIQIFDLLKIIIFISVYVQSIDVLFLDCSCQRAFHPVCGTDRQTYDSQCFLECLALAYEGTCCPSAELCADYFDPVCDQFGNFYANDCIFDFNKCAQHRSGGPLLFIEGRGEQACENAIAATAAKRLQNNKKNFNNNLNSAIIKRKNNEEIINGGVVAKPPPCHFFCDETVSPVCDSQLRTHKNRCKFELTACRLNSRGIFSALHIVREGPCRVEENNFAKFPRANSLRRLSPQTQRITNTKRKLPSSSLESTLNSENIKNNRNEGIQRTSPLPGAVISETLSNQQQQLELPPKQLFNEQIQKQKQGLQCDMCKHEGPFDQIIPVCDNTNRTHRSVCLFAQWNCERRSRGEEENVFVHVGECNNVSPIFDPKKEQCPNNCSHHFKPVCDSNGITHPNVCAYKLYRCLQRKMSGSSTGWLVSLRECVAPQTLPHIEQNKDNSLQHSKQPLTSIECFAEPNCDDQVEEAKLQQICDSDGRIHKNTCLFAHSHCLAAKSGKALRIIECPQLKKQQNNNTIITTTLSQYQQILTKISPKISENFASLPKPLFTTTLKTTTILNNQNEEKQKLLDCERRWNDCDDAPKDAYCGSDFRTYRNFYAIQKAQCLNHVEILFKGECEKCLANPCLTKRSSETNEEENDLLFVCDQGGETKSKCEFEVLRCIYEIKFGYNITAAYQGKCCPSIESCTGGPETLPICDSNNGRHSNWCSFEVAKCRSIKIHHKPLEERECINNNTKKRKENIEEREEELEKLQEAVISKKQSSLSNNSEVLQTVSAELLSIEQLICSDNYEPLCATDGRTYKNGCHLERYNASLIEKNKNNNDSSPLRVLYPGECCPELNNCNNNYSPICDSENTTHYNFCQFSHQRCLVERTKAQNLTIISFTRCGDIYKEENNNELNFINLLLKSQSNESFNLL